MSDSGMTDVRKVCTFCPNDSKGTTQILQMLGNYHWKLESSDKSGLTGTKSSFNFFCNTVGTILTKMDGRYGMTAI